MLARVSESPPQAPLAAAPLRRRKVRQGRIGVFGIGLAAY